MAPDISGLSAAYPDATSTGSNSAAGEPLENPGPASSAAASSAPGAVNNLQGQVGWLRECLDHYQISEAPQANEAVPPGPAPSPMQPPQLQPNEQLQQTQTGLLKQDSSHPPEDHQTLDGPSRAKLSAIAKDSLAADVTSSLPSSKDQADPAVNRIDAPPVKLPPPARPCMARATSGTSQHESDRCKTAGEAMAADAQAAEQSADPVKHQEHGSLTQQIGSGPTIVSSSGLPDRADMDGRTREGQPAAVGQAAEHAGPEVGTPSQASHGKKDSDQWSPEEHMTPAASQGRTPALADPVVDRLTAACKGSLATAEGHSCLHDDGGCIIDTDPAASSDQPLAPAAADEVPALPAATDQASAAVEILGECRSIVSCPLEESFAVAEHGEASSSSSQTIAAGPAQPQAVPGLLSLFTPPHVRPGRVIWGPVLRSPWASCTQIDGPYDVEKLLAHKYQLPLSATAFSSVFSDERADFLRKHTDVCWTMARGKAQLDEEVRQFDLQRAGAKAARNAAKRRKQRECRVLANATGEDHSHALGTGTGPGMGPADNSPEHALAAVVPAASASAPHTLEAISVAASHQPSACHAPAQLQPPPPPAALLEPLQQLCPQNQRAGTLPAGIEPTSLQPASAQSSGSQDCKAGIQSVTAPGSEAQTPRPEDPMEQITSHAGAASPASTDTAKPAGSDRSGAPDPAASSTPAADAQGKVSTAQGSEGKQAAGASAEPHASAAAESTTLATTGPSLGALDLYLRGKAVLQDATRMPAFAQLTCKSDPVHLAHRNRISGVWCTGV